MFFIEDIKDQRRRKKRNRKEGDTGEDLEI
jgi:hypothetical protein